MSWKKKPKRTSATFALKRMNYFEWRDNIPLNERSPRGYDDWVTERTRENWVQFVDSFKKRKGKR